MTTSTVDWEQLDMIADGYTPDFVDIYREFESDLPRIVRELASAVAAGDPAQAARAAHQAKGSAANFGFTAFSALMAGIESAAKVGSVAGAAGDVATAEQVLGESFRLVREQRGI